MQMNSWRDSPLGLICPRDNIIGIEEEQLSGGRCIAAYFKLTPSLQRALKVEVLFFSAANRGGRLQGPWKAVSPDKQLALFTRPIPATGPPRCGYGPRLKGYQKLQDDPNRVA
jgi:hypothetical protein